MELNKKTLAKLLFKISWKDITDTYFPSGSRYICYPPVLDTDEDWFVLDKTGEVEQLLKLQGYTISETYYKMPVISYRKKQENVIIIKNRPMWLKYKKATELCKYLNLRNKAHRIAVFNAITEEITDMEFLND